MSHQDLLQIQMDQKASQKYRILLLDQRGTGLSTPISQESLSGMDDEGIAKYLTFFRADNIVEMLNELNNL